MCNLSYLFLARGRRSDSRRAYDAGGHRVHAAATVHGRRNRGRCGRGGLALWRGRRAGVGPVAQVSRCRGHMVDADIYIYG